MSSFAVPKISQNTSSWGPTSTSTPSQFLDLPYAPYGKSDRLGKCADFTSNSQWAQKKDQRRRVDDTQANGDFQYKVDTSEEITFQLVDTSKAPKMASSSWKKRSFQPRRNNQQNRRGNGTQVSTAETKAQAGRPRRTRAPPLPSPSPC